jgi:hypothetical protein
LEVQLKTYLQFNEDSVLNDSGKVSYEIALALAETQFKKYKAIQDRLYKSDFDKLEAAVNSTLSE